MACFYQHFTPKLNSDLIASILYSPIFFKIFGHFIAGLEGMLYLCTQIINDHGNNTN